MKYPRILILTIFLLGICITPAQSVTLDGNNNPILSFDVEMNRYLVAYDKTAGGYHSIKGIFISNTGSLIGSEFAIGTATEEHFEPDVAFDPFNRKFLVVFKDFRNYSESDTDIFAQFVNQDGSLSGENFAITTAASIQRSPKIAYDSVNHRYLVVWVDYRDNLDVEIYGQLLDESGEKIGSEINFSSVILEQSFPFVAFADSSQKYLVGWRDVDYSVYGLIADKDGNKGSLLTITGDTNPKEDPHASYDSSNDRFLVLWRDVRTNPYGDILGQFVKTDSTLSGENFTIIDGDFSKATPRSAFNKTTDQFFVGWRDSRNEITTKIGPKKGVSTYDLFGNYLSTGGETSGDDFAVFEDAAKLLLSLSIAANSNCSNFAAGYSMEDTIEFVMESGFSIVGDACSAAPSSPELVYPANEETGVKTSMTFNWNESTDPDEDEVSYGLLYCEDENFAGCEAKSVGETAKIYQSAGFSGLALILGSLFLLGFLIRRKQVVASLLCAIVLSTSITVISCSSSDATSYKVTDLKAATTYYWKVIANDSGGGITHSETRSFTTE